MPPSRAP